MSTPLQNPRCRIMGLSLLLLVSLILLLFRVIPTIFQPSALEKVLDSGKLTIVTRNSPTTYYEGPEGATGFEYELAQLFADSLGVELKVITPENLNDIFTLLDQGKADFAAAGLTVTESRKQRVRFAASYQTVTEQLVYHRENKRPKNYEDINGRLDVVAGSSHIETLQKLQTQYPDLKWNARSGIESEELLQQVDEQQIDYTIADSNEVDMNQRFMLNLKVAFDISEPKQLAWAFPKSTDSSLYDKTMSFFWKILNNGELTQLIERHYGHVTQFDYVGNRIYLRHIKNRLIKYQKLFQEAAEVYGHDWKLLAAMGYQESHWNPRAISPTGVRGIMMLTRETAGQMGIKNRLNPKSSIFGGAQYLAKIKKKFPGIPEPDKTWFALASYNVGYYHVRDAQKIATQMNKNPNSWADLKTVLPLLSRKKYYKKTAYGYARGWEPVKYVENIRRYYDVLNYQFNKNSREVQQDPEVFKILPSVL